MAPGADGVVITRPVAAEAGLPFAGLSDLFGDLVDADELDLAPPQRMALDVALMRAAPAEPIQPLAISLAVLELLRASSAASPSPSPSTTPSGSMSRRPASSGLRCGGSSARPWS